MERFATAALRSSVHLVQLAGAISACILYTDNFDGVDKDYRWKYAITICAFSMIGTMIQGVFVVFFYNGFDETWATLSGMCSFILFILWTGVLGTFARSFSHLDADGNYGIHMMQIAVYIDAANMVIWFATWIYMAFLSTYVTRPRAGRGHAAGADPDYPAFNRRNSNINFVPYGWDTVDLERQDSTIVPGGNATAADPAPAMVQNIDAPPVLPMPVPDTTQLNPLVPPSAYLADRLNEPVREVSRPILPMLPPPPPASSSTSLSIIKPAKYQHSSFRRIEQPTYERVTGESSRSNAKAVPSSSSAPPEPLTPSVRTYSWPIPLDSDEPTRECPICAEEFPRYSGFPPRIARACSSHDQEACRQCIAKAIEVELSSNISGEVHCLECRAVLDYQEVKVFASEAIFDKYVAKNLRNFVNADPNFVWCQSPECEAGQEHVGGIDQPIVTCQSCGFKTCFKHQIPWHENMLCEEYDARLPISDDEHRLRAQQEIQSVAAVHEYTKPCANRKCRAPIQKNKGCDHMTCWACGHEFCWVCGEKWKGPHRLGCGYRAN